MLITYVKMEENVALTTWVKCIAYVRKISSATIVRQVINETIFCLNLLNIALSWFRRVKIQPF